MRYVRSFFFLMLPLFLFSLQGCGGGSGSSSGFNPSTTSTSSSTTQQPTSTQSVTYKMAAAPNVTSVDANNGQVVVTATLTGSTGAVVSGQTVTFSIAAGPATVTPSLVNVVTDSNGQAVTLITAGNTLTTTNVIVQATAAISGQVATAQTTFQVARGSGVITFPNSPMTNEKTIGTDVPSEYFIEQIPFTVTDSNGNPRVGVPVTLSVYSHFGTGLITVDYLQNPVTEPNQQTVTTDSQGKGIFNVTVLVAAPGPGLNTVDSIVFKAVTNDANPLVAYAGLMTNLIETTTTSTSSTLTISPAAANFVATDVAGATVNFVISGGTAPYVLSTSNPGLVSVVLQPDGVTAIATLLDASLWTNTVTITVTDAASHTATATIKRQ